MCSTAWITPFSPALSKVIFSKRTGRPRWRISRPEFQLDPGNRLSPVDYGDVCINYDKAYFAENDLPVPAASLEDLLKPEYNGLLVCRKSGYLFTRSGLLAGDGRAFWRPRLSRFLGGACVITGWWW
jgi:thiamine transport system substrate-binding protein